jgi:hypothetical protein
MPAVIAAPEGVAYAEHDSSEAQPQARAAHRGFWYTLAQYIVRPPTKRSHRTLRSWAMPCPQQRETPVEVWARPYPHLSLQACAGPYVSLDATFQLGAPWGAASPWSSLSCRGCGCSPEPHLFGATHPCVQKEAYHANRHHPARPPH